MTVKVNETDKKYQIEMGIRTRVVPHDKGSTISTTRYKNLYQL